MNRLAGICKRGEELVWKVKSKQSQAYDIARL
ncbi:Uncharacterised protein [Plesiomonas shigelloides]|nr:Uncharacterised protein [Plesiomonas shigelloides]